MRGKVGVMGIVVSLLAMAMVTRPVVNTDVARLSFEASDINAPELYRLNCAGCHGIDRQGNPPTFPSLVNIKDKKSKEEIIIQVKKGKGAMPPLAHLTDAEINAIISYLYNEESAMGGDLIVAELSADQKGEMLFKSNCTGCHRSLTTDPRPQNANTKMCGMMEPATLSGVPDWYNKNEFAKVLDKGPCYMPSFSFMSRDDKDAVFDYLATLKDSGIPKKPGGGMMMMRKQGKRKRGWMCF